MADPWAWWSAEAIASASDCPLENVREHWPRMFEQLGHCGIQTPNIALGVIGTTAIESASHFAPVREGCYLGEPEPAESHRRTLDYYPFYGRGQIQLTHESNYQAYGPKVAELWGADASSGIFDLVATPDHALEPDMAAAVIALFFRDTRALPSESYPEGYTLVQACETQDWEWVRILGYGGSDPAGTARIESIATALGPPGGEAIVPEPEPLPVFDPSFPAFAQNDDWSCAPTSTRWGLWAYGRQPKEQWLEGSMLSSTPPVVTMQYGLMDSTGGQLAEWISREYGEYGFRGENDPSVTFEEVAVEAAAQRHPLMMGGHSWGAAGHWTGVRGYDPTTNHLLLANPASGYDGVTQTMTREQFRNLGPFSMVRLTHPEAEGAYTPPPRPPDGDPFAPWRATVGSGLLELMGQDGTRPAQRGSTWLPLGVTPADVETCYGENAVLYGWLLTTNQGFRTRPI